MSTVAYAESEGTPPRNFKRLRKEFDAFKATDGRIFLTARCALSSS